MLRTYFHKQVKIAPLVVFRILFGAVMLYGVVRFACNGWIEKMYIYPKFFFAYQGFEWVKPFGPTGMYILFWLMGISAFFIMLGFLYRVSSLLFFLAFTYVELIDKTTYLNHYYFVSIIAFLMLWLPAHRSFSLDVRLGITKPVERIPAWMRDVIKLQLGMVYFFAGIAKINADWLLEAQPLRIWLHNREEMAIIGPWLAQDWVAYFFSWAGMFYDIFIPFVLLSPKYRAGGYVAVVVFHVLTRLLFNIGMFPFIMIGATTIFFSDEFHEKIIRSLQRILRWNSIKRQTVVFTSGFRQRGIFILFFLHFFVQMLLPFRYLAYPGNLFWTEEGFRFSWRVMLIEKAGHTVFHVGDPSFAGEMEVYPSEYLTDFQQKMMCTQPDMILQFAHFLRDEFTGRKVTFHGRTFVFSNPTVRADAHVSLNGHGHRKFIDPTVDLASQPVSWKHKSWILPEHE